MRNKVDTVLIHDTKVVLSKVLLVLLGETEFEFKNFCQGRKTKQSIKRMKKVFLHLMVAMTSN